MTHKSVGLAMRDVGDAYDTLPGTPEREKGLQEAFKTVRVKELDHKLAALRSRGEPSVPAQLVPDGLDCQLRRKWLS